MGSNDFFGQHAQVYARFSEHSLTNAAYDRPAILRIAGELSGKRVLELGCAGGVLTQQLIESGGRVLALDREPAMVAAARDRVRDSAREEVADLERPLDFVASGSVHVVVASLVLHYIENRQPLLAELRRCLTPGGVFVFSIHHPITGWQLSDQVDYHRTELVHETWDWDGQKVTGSMYRHPLSVIFGDLLAAGFNIDAVEEPRPTPDAAERDPRVATILTTMSVFLFIRAVRADGGRASTSWRRRGPASGLEEQSVSGRLRPSPHADRD
jgi:SAM-dependent methyltransferase